LRCPHQSMNACARATNAVSKSFKNKKKVLSESLIVERYIIDMLIFASRSFENKKYKLR
jgi:hypothetical protein